MRAVKDGMPTPSGENKESERPRSTPAVGPARVPFHESEASKLGRSIYIARCTPLSPYKYKGKWPRRPFSARVERAHSDRARSASRRTTRLPVPPLDALF